MSGIGDAIPKPLYADGMCVPKDVQGQIVNFI